MSREEIKYLHRNGQRTDDTIVGSTIRFFLASTKAKTDGRLEIHTGRDAFADISEILILARESSIEPRKSQSRARNERQWVFACESEARRFEESIWRRNDNVMSTSCCCPKLAGKTRRIGFFVPETKLRARKNLTSRLDLFPHRKSRLALARASTEDFSQPVHSL